MSNTFNVQALIDGDMSQLSLFMNTTGQRSLYIEWVPDELTKESASSYFSELGNVTDIDFVKQKNGKSRMMFVHFDGFHAKNEGIIQAIASVHPNAFEMPISFPSTNPNYHSRDYKLRCHVNTKPIQRVEYNPAQLTDMVDRLRKEIEELKEVVALLVKNKVGEVV